MARVNHAGRPVSLWEGPAVVLALLAGTVASRRLPAAVATAALVGAVDDHGPRTTAKGLAGHLGELQHGRVTTGSVKLVGLSAAGLLTADAGSRIDRLVHAGLVAGCANLTNLLDLRPGRALKAAVLTALPLLVAGSARDRSAGTGAAAAVVGTALAALPADLAGRSMLGDTGANALGTALGAALAERLGRAGRLIALAVVTALTLASERVSLTEVIAATPLLDAADRWGRTADPA